MSRRRISNDDNRSQKASCISVPTVYHAAIVIFLEFFAFGLLTTPMISVLNETFPKHTLLMNGIIQGVKGFLSFLSAPLIGALSDGIGRKPFLLLTVTFTCSPLPLMKISHWWYFTMISISGIFAVTFSVALAYVADITTEEDRSWSYGLVSATFAASLVTSPAIGAYLGRVFSEDLVVALATAIAFLDIFFILACVPESLPDKIRPTHTSGSPTTRPSSTGGSSCGGKLSWDKVDPFAALRKVTNDHLVLIICITTFFSYLPEAGQYSCFFVYLSLVMGFTEENVALFIAVGGILACFSQTVLLSVLNSYMGPKQAIIIGLVFEAIQLALYGFATHHALLWIAGSIAALGSITYPALSAFVSKHAAADQQGVAQGLVTGIRGLCGGLGPALFGLIFYVFRVDLNTQTSGSSNLSTLRTSAVPTSPEQLQRLQETLLPGAPFAFGAILVLVAIFVALFIPENPKTTVCLASSSDTTSSALIHGVPLNSFAGHRLRRLSSHGDSCDKQCLIQCDQADESTYAHKTDFPDSRLFSSKNSKDHFVADTEPGFWDRWLFGWSDQNRRRFHTRRSARLFRQPTVSFTRARFVEPIRRLIYGFFGGRYENDSINEHTVTLTSVQPAKFDLSVFEGCDVSITRNPVFSSSWRDAEAADLSNYRSQHLRPLLATSSSKQVPFNRQLSCDYHPARPHGAHTSANIVEPNDRTALLSSPYDGFTEPEDDPNSAVHLNDFH